MYYKLIKYAAYTGIGLYLFDFFARTFYWYVRMPHIDMISHTLGGMFTACIVMALAWRFGYGSFSLKHAIVYAFIAIALGIVWEYYEYVVYLLIKGKYVLDVGNTLSDVVCDSVGGILAVFVVFIRNKGYNKGNE